MLQEARETLARHCEPVTYYQLASAYALTIKDHPEDRIQALAYLQRAMQEGYRDFNYIEKDPDLANLRGDKQFTDLLSAARTFYQPPLSK
jgi:hypothetical protein